RFSTAGRQPTASTNRNCKSWGAASRAGVAADSSGEETAGANLAIASTRRQLDRSVRDVGTLPAQDPNLFASKVPTRDREGGQLLGKARRQLEDVCEARESVGDRGENDQAVVPFAAPLFGILLQLENTQRVPCEHRSRRRWAIREHHGIQRIPIGRKGVGDEA